MDHDSSGNLTELIDAAGNTRMMSYDGEHLLSVDQWVPYDTTFSYDGNGLLDGLTQGPVSYTIASANSAQVLSTAGQPLATTIDGAGDTTTYLLDTRGRELEEEQPDGATATWQLDFAGDPSEFDDFDSLITTYYYNGSGDLVYAFYPNGTSESYQYNAFNEPTEETDPDGDVTVWAYNPVGDVNSQTTGYGTPQADKTVQTWSNGLILTMTDPEGNETTYTHSGYLLTAETVKNTLNQVLSSRSFSYNTAGNLTLAVDSDGGSTQYQYDNNNLTLTVDPDGITTSQQFDAAGLPVSASDGRGVQTDYYYDAAGLETAEVDAANTTLAEATDSAYNAAGELTLRVDPNGNASSFAYDKDGDQTLMIQGVGATNAVTSSAYDQDGNLTLSVDPDGDTSS